MSTTTKRCAKSRWTLAQKAAGIRAVLECLECLDEDAGKKLSAQDRLDILVAFILDAALSGDDTLARLVFVARKAAESVSDCSATADIRSAS